MPISPARTTAFDILLRVEREDSYASELLHSTHYKTLSAPDHGLATEIVMGVLRWQSLLDAEITRFSSQKLPKLDLQVLIALRLGAYQLLMLDRVPARAAIHESVELVKRARKKSAAPFVNALLRKISGGWIQEFGEGLQAAKAGAAEPRVAIELQQKALTPAYLASRYAHPEWIVERWMKFYGGEKAAAICRYDQEAPETAIRLPRSGVEEELERAGVVLERGRLLTSAAVVASGDLTRTGPFIAGKIAIQDEASQLVALLLGEGSKILDCCAAPGSKTAAISERQPQANIVAIELHPHRARLLQQRLAGVNVQIINADIRELPVDASYDRVLVDVPCSGTGTLARNPEIKWRLTPEDLSDLQGRQVAIVASAMKQVADRGRLLYSTCSLEREENEEVVQAALNDNRNFHVIDCREELSRLRSAGELAWEDLDSLLAGRFLRTIPGIHPCDGFFAAMLEKD